MGLQPYTNLIDKHSGESAFIIGAGPSLAKIFYEKPLDKIFDHVVVSTNSSCLIMPWEEGDPDRRYWVSNDALCRRWSWWKKVKAMKATKVVRESWKPHFEEIPDFLVFNRRPTPEDEIEPDDIGLAYCSSVPSSIDLALQMGCKQIFLVGVDQYMVGVRSHFWQFFPKHEQPKRIDKCMATHTQQYAVFEYNDIAYLPLKEFADYKGAVIYNCNPWSKVRIFDFCTFEEALGKADILKEVKSMIKKHVEKINDEA